MECKVRTLVGENSITLDDGEKVYEVIYPELAAGRAVVLDFEGVGVFASPFFNVAIGRLLRDFSPGDLNRLLKVSNLSPAGLDVLKRVIENSKQYYADEHTRKALDDVLAEQAEKN